MWISVQLFHKLGKINTEKTMKRYYTKERTVLCFSRYVCGALINI